MSVVADVGLKGPGGRPRPLFEASLPRIVRRVVDRRVDSAQDDARRGR